MRRSWGMHLSLSVKVFFLKWRKKNHWLKIWRKFRYMWYVYLSRPMFKGMFTRKEGHGNLCECIGEFEKCSNLLYRFIFRESLAKVLLKPWRKTAFIWRLGGLNCGLAKASLQEYCSLGVGVSELADEGEQGPKYYAKASNLNVQQCAATTEKLRWLICPRSCSILAWCTAKVKHGYGESLAKVFFFSEDVLFRVKEFRTTLIYCLQAFLFI